MTLSLTPLSLRRRLRRRIHNLPVATRMSHVCTIWVRVDRGLACKVCGRP